MTALVPRRVLLIGLDGGSFRLLQPLLDAGELPEIAQLMQTGRYGELHSTFPSLTPPAWSTVITGKNPGKHGIFSFRELAWRGYTSGPLITSENLRARTLWEIAGDAGRIVGAINVPPSYPVRPLNGFMVACLLAPPRARTIAFPREIEEVLGPDYEVATEPPRGLSRSAPDYRSRCLDYLRQLRHLAERRVQVTHRLLTERPWDLLGVVFYEPDRIQHFFWDYLLGAVPDDVDRTVASEIAAAARPIYRIVDAGIGQLVRAAGPDAAVVLVSDHGFGHAPGRVARINWWLHEQGLLRTHRTWRWRRRVLRQLPATMRARLDTVDQVVDWRRTSAWCEVIEPRSAGVWINLRGRHPQGMVEPRDYPRLRDSIRERLMALTDDGQRVFDLVAPREEVYHGPCTAEAPDLLLYTSPSHGLRFNAIRSEIRNRHLFGPFVDDVWPFTGAHDPSGIYIASGAGIDRGGSADTVPVEAVAPTVLALLGVPIPDAMDAPPRLDWLTPAARAALPVHYVEDREPSPRDPASGYAPDDTAEVAARLRALGYVE